MRTLYIFKAQPTDRPIETLQIALDREIPEVQTLSEAEQLYEKEAAALAKVLIATLPGGTLCQLTVHLLRHKASLLAVPNTKE